MQLLHVLRKQYWQIAFFLWLISFLVIKTPQWQINFTYLIILAPVLISLNLAELKKFFSEPLAKCLLLLIFTLVISGFIDGEPLRQAKYGLLVILFYIAVSRLPNITNKEIWRTAWIFLYCLLLYVGANMVWKFSIGGWLPGDRLVDLWGKLGNPIYVTDTMTACLAIITFTGIQMRKYRYVLLAHCITLLTGLVVLQTRSAIPVWLAILGLSWIQTSSYRTKKQTLLFIFAASFIFLIAYSVSSLEIGNKLLARNVYRPEIWHGYIEESLRCGIWFGCGIGYGFRYISHDGNLMAHAHNIFVAQFFKAGLIGLAPLFVMSSWAAIYGIKSRVWAGWFFVAGVVALCFDGNNLIHSPNEYWLLFHLPLALLINQRKHITYSDGSSKPPEIA